MNCVYLSSPDPLGENILGMYILFKILYMLEIFWQLSENSIILGMTHEGCVEYIYSY